MKAKVNICLFEVFNFVSGEHHKYFLPYSFRKERNMYLKQKDIFRAMNKSFVKKIMNVSTTESYEQGGFLFKQGDLANLFYIF
jgi:hypothetical protein